MSPATDQSVFAVHKSIFSVENWAREIGNIAKFTASYENAPLSIAK